MATTGIISAWRLRPDVTMAALGLISGLMSVSVGFSDVTPHLAWLQPVATVFGLGPELVSIGFYYGVAIALGIWLATANLWAVPVLLVTTMYAWSAAVQVAIRLQRTTDDDPHLIAASLAAGAVGAGITHLGCALFARQLRRPMRIAVTCLVGALAGMLLFVSHRKMIDERWLYVIWQPAVAFCIGMGLAGRSQDA